MAIATKWADRTLSRQSGKVAHARQLPPRGPQTELSRPFERLTAALDAVADAQDPHAAARDFYSNLSALCRQPPSMTPSERREGESEEEET